MKNQLIKALEISLTRIDEVDTDLWKRIGLKTYKKDKWTIPTILQHLIDWERIWCFRALLFARAEGSIPDAHDQEIMGKNSNADKRTIEELLAELRMVRQSTLMLFQSFDAKTLEINCVFFEYEMPISAIGFIITSHQIHHLNIINERYIPLQT